MPRWSAPKGSLESSPLRPQRRNFTLCAEALMISFHTCHKSGETSPYESFALFRRSLLFPFVLYHSESIGRPLYSYLVAYLTNHQNPLSLPNLTCRTDLRAPTRRNSFLFDKLSRPRNLQLRRIRQNPRRLLRSVRRDTAAYRIVGLDEISFTYIHTSIHARTTRGLLALQL